MISNDQIFSSFKNRGTLYFHNMLLDVLTKIMQFGVYTFFLSSSAAEFHWTEIIQVAARQYGEMLTDEQVNAMDWIGKSFEKKSCYCSKGKLTKYSNSYGVKLF